MEAVTRLPNPCGEQDCASDCRWWNPRRFCSDFIAAEKGQFVKWIVLACYNLAECGLADLADISCYTSFLIWVVSDSVISVSIIANSLFRLYQIPLYLIPLYHFPLLCYIRFHNDRFCNSNFQFHVMTVSVISDFIIAVSLYCYFRFCYSKFMEICYSTFCYIKFCCIMIPHPHSFWFLPNNFHYSQFHLKWALACVDGPQNGICQTLEMNVSDVDIWLSQVWK